jgi:hypothetical protein
VPFLNPPLEVTVRPLGRRNLREETREGARPARHHHAIGLDGDGWTEVPGIDIASRRVFLTRSAVRPAAGAELARLIKAGHGVLALLPPKIRRRWIYLRVANLDAATRRSNLPKIMR